MAQHGQVLKLRSRRGDGKARWAYRYRVNGSSSKRPQVGGFATRAEAERALKRELARRRPGRDVTLTELVAQYLTIHQAAPSTIAKLAWLLSKATSVFGERPVASLRPEEICTWRGTLPEGHRFEATQALRQVLNAAVAWELIDVNPARRGVPNPQRCFPEKRPFDSWIQIRELVRHLDPTKGAMVLFGAATGLRPAELVALETRDVDHVGGVVYVRRQLVRGQIKQTKTHAAFAPSRCRRSRSRRLNYYPRPRAGSCSPRLAPATSTCTTSARATGAPLRLRPRSIRSAARTTCATPTPPLRSEPAFRSSTSPGSWARAWR